MISTIVSRLVILLFGTLYPAYASYKAVRTKNVKEYVKWMMYWIVFALFTCAETFTDVFLSFWFPFYYEIKIIIVIWLLSPATKGSSILYRKFVHPMLCKREQEIDEYISRAREQGYHTMLHLGSKGVTYATTVIMQTAIKGGGGIVNHLRRSYSLSDLSTDPDLKADVNRNSKALPEDTLDAGDPSRDLRLRAARKPGGSHVDLYFPEMDVDVRSHGHHSRETSVILNQIRSSEDISSGYSSADGAHGDGSTLLRTASVGAPRRGRGGRGARSRRATTEDVYQDFSAHELIDFGTQHFLDNSYPLAPLLPVLMSQDITSHNKTLTTELLNLLQNALNKEAVVISNILDTKDNANNFPMDDICLKEEHVNYENSKAEKVDSETCIDGNACAIISQSVQEKDVDTVVTLNLKDEHTESSPTTVVACVDDVDKFDETQYEAEITREKTVDNFGSCHNSKQVDNVFSETDDPKAEEISYEHIYSLSDDSELFVDAEGEDVCITEETQTEQPDEFQDKNVELINENTITESGELKIKKESVFHEDHLLHVEDAESVASSTDDQSNCGDTENLDNKDRKFRKGKYHKLRAPLPPASKVTIESCNYDGDKKLENKSTTVKISDCYTNVNCSLKNKTEQLRREFFSNDNKTQDIVIASNFVPDEVLGDESFREHENFIKSDSRIELKTSSDVNIHQEKTSCTPNLENKGKSKLNIFSSVKKILHKNEETTENNPDSVLIPLKGNCETETKFKCEDNTGQDKVMIRQMSSSPSQKKRFLFN